MYDKYKAFTLVELLIVLSIVAILAMVAAPKMVESKLLSKLAQTYQDQRLLQNALDSYFMDYGEYPRDQLADWLYGTYYLRGGYTQLTSPIRYLEKIMADPFREPKPDGQFYTYQGESGSDESYFCPNGRVSNRCIHAYLIVGYGPNKRSDTNVGTFPYGHWYPSGRMSYLVSYSPTNGSESWGDIYRLMGDYQRGEGFLDFMHFAWVGNTYQKGSTQK